MEESAVLRAPRGRHHLLPSIAARACEEQPELKGVLMELVDCRQDDRQGEVSSMHAVMDAGFCRGPYDVLEGSFPLLYSTPDILV